MRPAGPRNEQRQYILHLWRGLLWSLSRSCRPLLRFRGALQILRSTPIPDKDRAETLFIERQSKPTFASKLFDFRFAISVRPRPHSTQFLFVHGAMVRRS